ncbi:MAG TPA: hypothetical protein VE974_14365 [Thermoanaerobaculia bacterium]|nr:hypothetical protein [Thermoanaerobaculia bacterium]
MIRRLKRQLQLAVSFIAALGSTASAAQGQEVVQVVIASARNWTTDIVAIDDGTDTSNDIIPLSDCTGGSVSGLRLTPGGTDIARDIASGEKLCELRGRIGILPVVNPGAIESHLTLFDPATGRTSFLLVGALDTALQKRGDRVRIPLISNARGERTWIVVFGDPGPLTIQAYNNQKQLVDISFVDAAQFQPAGWRLLLYPLPGTVDIGEVIVTEGHTSIPNQSIPDRTYYGFAFVANEDGTPRYVRQWQTIPQ